MTINDLLTNVSGMLTGEAIYEAQLKGLIEIDPFDPRCINPNSYNLKLHPQLKMYSNPVLDSYEQNETDEIIIPKDGLQLEPNKLYIGRTVERTHSDHFIPMLNGRSSGGRLGLSIHICAGFGDIGFNGTWTLEITVVHPLIVYPNMEIAQVSYFTPAGHIGKLYNNKYQNQVEAQESRMWHDLVEKENQ